MLEMYRDLAQGLKNFVSNIYNYLSSGKDLIGTLQNSFELIGDFLPPLIRYGIFAFIIVSIVFGIGKLVLGSLLKFLK